MIRLRRRLLALSGIMLAAAILWIGCSSPSLSDAGTLTDENHALAQYTRDLGIQSTAWGQRRVIQSMRASRRVMPHYPLAMKQRGLGGEVVVDVLVGPDGVPEAVAVVQSSGHPELDVAVASAMWNWRFYSWTEQGQPTVIVARQTIILRVQN